MFITAAVIDSTTGITVGTKVLYRLACKGQLDTGAWCIPGLPKLAASGSTLYMLDTTATLLASAKKDVLTEFEISMLAS